MLVAIIVHVINLEDSNFILATSHANRTSVRVHYTFLASEVALATVVDARLTALIARSFYRSFAAPAAQPGSFATDGRRCYACVQLFGAHLAARAVLPNRSFAAFAAQPGSNPPLGTFLFAEPLFFAARRAVPFLADDLV